MPSYLLTKWLSYQPNIKTSSNKRTSKSVSLSTPSSKEPTKPTMTSTTSLKAYKINTSSTKTINLNNKSINKSKMIRLSIFKNYKSQCNSMLPNILSLRLMVLHYLHKSIPLSTSPNLHPSNATLLNNNFWKGLFSNLKKWTLSPKISHISRKNIFSKLKNKLQESLSFLMSKWLKV